MWENQKAIAPKPLIFRGWHLILWCSRPTRCQLGGNEEAVDLSGSRLGWTTWLGGGPAHDRGDAMFAVG